MNSRPTLPPYPLSRTPETIPSRLRRPSSGMSGVSLIEVSEVGPVTDVSEITTPEIPTRELGGLDIDCILQHLMSLAASDRLLRFGHFVSDDGIRRYVDQIDFVRDTVFGAFGADRRLLGICHLGFSESSQNQRTAELGVSVAENARGRGLGSALFRRAATRCRNRQVTTLYMHCLSHNATMVHIARKAGMRIERDHGEADAYLRLDPADSTSILVDLWHDQAAARDYANKRQSLHLATWFGAWLGSLSNGAIEHPAASL